MHSMLPWNVSGTRQKLNARGWSTHVILNGSLAQNQVVAVFYSDHTKTRCTPRCWVTHS